ncbi:lysostaphin resistance A-like protein [Verrucomicrobiota bacterium]
MKTLRKFSALIAKFADARLSPLLLRLFTPDVYWMCGIGVFGFSAFFLMQRFGLIEFWGGFASLIWLLLLMALGTRPELLRSMLDDINDKFLLKFAGGLLSGILLYGVFWLARYVQHLILPEWGDHLRSVYRFGLGASELRIMLTIGFLIGPAEELFWRGFVQDFFTEAEGPWKGFFIGVALYVIAHLVTLNPMLIGAAVIAGGYWALLYRFFKSVTLNIASHVVFDLLAFVILPFNSLGGF